MRGDHQPALRLTLLGAAGPGKTRVITATVQKCRGYLGPAGPLLRRHTLG